MLSHVFTKSSRSSSGACLEARLYSARLSAVLSATFTKSSKSLNTANCLEARWKSANDCGNGTCVEGRTHDGMVQIRDSKLGTTSPVLSFSPTAWQEFTDGIKAGDLD